MKSGFLLKYMLRFFIFKFYLNVKHRLDFLSKKWSAEKKMSKKIVLFLCAM